MFIFGIITGMFISKRQVEKNLTKFVCLQLKVQKCHTNGNNQARNQESENSTDDEGRFITVVGNNVI